MSDISTRAAIKKLCRVCLTQSKRMDPLSNILDEKKPSSPTILYALESLMSIEVINDGMYPSEICGMCLGLLKISYELKQQFESSYNILKELFGEEKTIEEQPVSRAKPNEPAVPVELIIGQSKYNIKDVVIIEEENPEKDYFDGFLKNLGSTITAEFVNKSYKYQPKVLDEVDPVVLVEKPLSPEPEVVQVVEIVTDSLELESGRKIKKRRTNTSDVDQFIVNQENSSAFPLVEPSDVDKEILENALNVHYQCTNCQKYFTVRGRYLIHMKKCLTFDRVVHDETGAPTEVMICSFCDELLMKSELFDHIQMKHPTEKTFKCQECDHISFSRSALAYHKLKHGTKRFMCNVCGKKFYAKNSLVNHANHHSDATQNLCPVCGKSYKSSLAYHMKIHTKERSYCCSFCDRKFYILNSLKRHLRTHTGIRPYACKFCDKAFFSRGEANKHEMLHTGVRPYKCEHCKRGFTSKFNLDTHKMSHPGGYECEICTRTFVEVSLLEKHKKMLHYLDQDDDEEQS